MSNSATPESPNGPARRPGTRRHTGLLEGGPTKGYHARVWGYLLELFVQQQVIDLTSDGQLSECDLNEFADRLILPTSTTREAFRWLGQHNLLVVTEDDAGRRTASPDLVALGALLRRERELQQRGARGSGSSAPTYFRCRHACVRLPWIEQVLEARPDVTEDQP
ncbi:MAG TPA: hypothetical protein VFZ65_01475 [Planctomycetota bacterium]|nr:hypothetical protein [Planctomycetota bacterium]